MTNSNYREQIYRHYATVFRGQRLEFSEAETAGWRTAFSRYLRGWLPEDRDAEFLDLGCGDGRLLHLLQKLGYRRIRGIDISPEQVALARQVTPEVMQGDVLEYLQRVERTYDVIFAFDILEHFDKEEACRFLQGCADSLATGGTLILSTPNAASPMFGFTRYGDFTHEISFSPECLRRTLALFGFDNVRMREIGPYSHGLRSALRTASWRLLRLGLLAWNLIEIGHDGGGVFTRNFLACADKTGGVDEAEERPVGRTVFPAAP